MFNLILDTGFFPTSWTKAVIIPVFKKGDINDLNNYRGISLVSNLGKLFTAVLNQRHTKWSQNNDIITDAQFGFRPGYGTVDAIFILHSIISHTLANKKRLYSAFVDFKMAFDSIDRCKLWYKIAKIGIRGQSLSILKNMYSNVKLCVTLNGFNSDFFRTSVGLMQGEVRSPILFSLYVNDFESEFLKSNCKSFDYIELNIFLLMHKDDMIIFSESVEGLQNELNTLSNCARSWGLKLNIKKTKVVVFRKNLRLYDYEKFYIDDSLIAVVNTFNYLDLHFN